MVSFGDLQTEAPLFFHPRISHVNLLSGEVAFEIQKGLGDAPFTAQISIIFLSPSNSQCAVYCAENIKGL